MKGFTCPKCGRINFVTRTQELFSMHLFGRYVYRKCKNCGKRHWLKRVDFVNNEN